MSTQVEQEPTWQDKLPALVAMTNMTSLSDVNEMRLAEEAMGDLRQMAKYADLYEERIRELRSGSRQLVEVTYNIRVRPKDEQYFQEMFPPNKKKECLAVHVARYPESERAYKPEVFESVSRTGISTELDDPDGYWSFKDSDGGLIGVSTMFDNSRFYTSLSDDALATLFSGDVFIDEGNQKFRNHMRNQGYRAIFPKQILV